MYISVYVATHTKFSMLWIFHMFPRLRIAENNEICICIGTINGFRIDEGLFCLIFQFKGL